MNSDSGQIARSSGIMAVGTILSRITGVIRTAAIVAVIGFGPFADAYTIANAVPNIVYTIVLGGAITAVFLPQIMRAMLDDADGGTRYTNALITYVGLLLLALSALAFLLAPLLIGVYGPADWPSDVRDTSVLFARFLLPQIFLYGIFAMLQQVLNAKNHFALPMYAPIANNAVVIGTSLLLIFVYQSNRTSGISSAEVAILGIGTTGGLLVQTALLLPMVKAVGFKFRPSFAFKGMNLSKPAKLALWSIGFVAVNQISYIAITRLSASANVIASDRGLTNIGFTSFQNAQLIFLLPYAVITVSIVTALFPRMTKAGNSNDGQSLRNHVTTGLTGVITTLVPASAVLFVIAPSLTVTLFARGASSLDESLATGRIVQAFVFGILPFSIYYLLLRAFYAKEDTITPFWLNLIMNVAAVALAIYFFAILPLEHKVLGLALALSVSYALIAIVTSFMVNRRIGRSSTQRILASCWRAAITGVIAAFVAWLVLQAVTPEVSLSIMRNAFALTLSVTAAGLAVLLTWRLLGVKRPGRNGA